MGAQEVLGKWPGVAETLQGTVHEASVSKVVETYYTSLCSRLLFKSHVVELFLIKFVLILTGAFMILLILLLALRGAVECILAWTLSSEYGRLVARLTFTQLARVLVVLEDEPAFFHVDLDHEDVIVKVDPTCASVNLAVGFIEHALELDSGKFNTGIHL